MGERVATLYSTAKTTVVTLCVSYIHNSPPLISAEKTCYGIHYSWHTDKVFTCDVLNGQKVSTPILNQS